MRGRDTWQRKAVILRKLPRPYLRSTGVSAVPASTPTGSAVEDAGRFFHFRFAMASAAWVTTNALNRVITSVRPGTSQSGAVKLEDCRKSSGLAREWFGQGPYLAFIDKPLRVTQKKRQIMAWLCSLSLIRGQQGGLVRRSAQTSGYTNSATGLTVGANTLAELIALRSTSSLGRRRAAVKSRKDFASVEYWVLTLVCIASSARMQKLDGPAVPASSSPCIKLLNPAKTINSHRPLASQKYGKAI